LTLFPHTGKSVTDSQVIGVETEVINHEKKWQR